MLDWHNSWRFQHVGVTLHLDTETWRALLALMFEDWDISVMTHHVSTPYSLDLDPLDFFFVGILQGWCLHDKPHDHNQQKQEFTTFFWQTSVDTCRAEFYSSREGAPVSPRCWYRALCSHPQRPENMFTKLKILFSSSASQNYLSNHEISSLYLQYFFRYWIFEGFPFFWNTLYIYA